jgi:transposase
MTKLSVAVVHGHGIPGRARSPRTQSDLGPIDIQESRHGWALPLFRIDCFGASGVAKRYELFETQQRRTRELLQSEAGEPRRSGADVWPLVDSVLLWVQRSGARSRDPPERQGKWKSVHKRLSHWATNGLTEWIFDSLTADPDDGYLMLATTLVRAHTATHPPLREPSNTFLGCSRFLAVL